LIVNRRYSIPHITLYPGDYYATDKPAIISTVLGSCVSACIYDPKKKIIGMNHFMLSNRRYAQHMPVCLTEAGRYGIHAMELLINSMLNLGAERKNLLAKAFGGGALFKDVRDNFFCVGEINCRFINEFLKNDGIPLVSSDLGGETGRVIRFVSDDYSVYSKKIQVQDKATSLVAKERQYWSNSIKREEEKTPEVMLWD
jgi:chemotaxis protein CheD